MAISPKRLVFGFALPFLVVAFVVGAFYFMGRYERDRRVERTADFRDALAKVEAEVGEEALEKLRRLPILYAERLQPLDSMARHTVRELSGEWAVFGADPVATFLSMAWDGKEMGWDEAPVFLVSFGKNRKLLGMEPADKYATWNQLAAEPVREYVMANEKKFADQIDLMPRADQELRLTVLAKLPRLQEGFRRSFLLVPPPEALRISDSPDQEDWFLPEEASNPRLGYEPAEAEELQLAFADLREAWRARDGAAIVATVDRLETAMVTLDPRASIPKNEVEAEISFNRASPFARSGWLYVAASLVALFATAFRKRPLRWLALLLGTAGLALTAYGFYLRVVLGFGVAITNLYESMVAVSFCTVLFAIIFDLSKKTSWGTFVGGFGAFVVLQFLDLYTQKFDARIGGTVAVLANNVWVHIHVPVVMSSYAAYFVAWLLSLITLPWTLSDWKARNAELGTLLKTATTAMALGTILILVGMVLGGLWAHDSWGRFWGWDPKETWSLILFVYYAAVVHLTWTRVMNPFFLSCCLYFGGFWLLFTYYGTNELLSGLHSYAASAAEGSTFWDNFVSEKNRWFLWTTSFLLLSSLALFAVGFLRTRAESRSGDVATPADGADA